MGAKLNIRTVLVVFLLSIVFIFNLTKISDPDFFWHLKTGQKILTGGILKADPYSWTFPGRSWHNHEWLSQVFFYWLYSKLGFGALIIMKASVITAAFYILFLTLSGISSSFEVSLFVSALAGWLGAISYSMRPWIFSYLLFALVMFILYVRRRRKAEILFALPAIFLLWSNLHGLFVIGIAVTGVFAAEEIIRNGKPGKITAALALSLAASCLNPWGVKALLFPFQYLAGEGHIHTNYITEWFSPDFHERYGKVFFAFILISMSGFAFSKKKIFLRDVFLYFVFLFLALDSARNIPLFLIAASPAAAGHLASALKGILSESRAATQDFVRNSRLLGAFNYFLIPAALAFVVLTYRTNFIDGYLLEKDFPVKAAGDLKKLKPERLLNSYHWGGYLIYRGIPVFIDGRADFYPGKFLKNFFLATRLEKDPEGFIKKYGFDCVLWDKNSPLSFYLEKSPGWKKYSSYGSCDLFLRTSDIRHIGRAGRHS